MGGRSSGRQKGQKYSNYTRPAETTGRAKTGKVPKGVKGQSIGGGAKRAQKGDGCAVTAIALMGGILATIAGAGWGIIEAAKAVI